MQTNIEKFNHTVGILVKAYLNNTLKHGNCAACAVGNIVAASLGCRVVKGNDRLYKIHSLEWVRDGKTLEPIWGFVFRTDEPGGRQKRNPKKYRGVFKLQIDSTGYTWQQLARIESAFESVPYGNSDDEWMFNGLMAVVDALARIHSIDLELKEKARNQFVKV